MKKTNLLLILILIPTFLITSIIYGQTKTHGVWSGTLTIMEPAYGAPSTKISGKIALNFDTKKGEYEIATIGKKDFDFKVTEINKKYDVEIILDIPELELEETYLRSINYSVNKIKLEGFRKKISPRVEIIMEIVKEL